MRKIVVVFALIALCQPFISHAGTYWASPTGAATWGNCASATPLSGTAACSRTTVLANAQAGDTVYFRSGTYTISASGLDYEGIKSTNSGSAGNLITYSAYNNESVIITSNNTTSTYGVYLNGNSYIKITGFTFQDIATWGYVVGSSHHNEISYSSFTSTGGKEAGNGLMISATLVGTCATTKNCWNTHNWIHHNTLSKKMGADPCAEGVDLIRIGSGYTIGQYEDANNYNTIEDNILSYAAHTPIDNYGQYNVIRNNTIHNEPWITTCTVGQTGKEISYDTSSSSVAIGTGDKTFTVSAGKTYSTGSPVGVISPSDHSKSMQGVVKSYSGTTLVITVSGTAGTGTYSDWIVSKGNYPYYETASYSGNYGHRNLQLTDDYGRDGTYVLVEGNRLGHASNNPGNGGPMNLDLAAPKNIVRYNAIFNGMSSGIYFKYASADLTSIITSSTALTIATGAQTFTIPTGLHLTNGQTFRAWSQADKTKAMTGTVTSYTSGTGELVTNVTAVNGSGTVSDWQIFWNGASGGVNNRVYNNTIYHNGNGYDWRAYGNENVGYSGQGIAQANAAGSGSTLNIIKNNIIYDNKEGVVCSEDLYNGDSSTDQCSAQAWDTVINNLTSDPVFVNPDLTDTDSTTLPNLSLQASSGAINGGTYLTQANGSGTNSTTLIVDDAMYFQDGTWGSSLATTSAGLGGTFQADWVAVGSVGNMAQISSINYATNTITLASPLTWADDANVWLYKKSDGTRVLYGLAPDYGAYESNYPKYLPWRIQ